MKLKILSILLLFASFSSLSSQESDSTDVHKIRAFPLPVVLYTPETELGFGGMSLFTFRFKGETRESRNSQFQLGALYTLRDQFLLFTPFQLYLKDEEYYAYGRINYFSYSYWFYGIGADSREEDEELFDVNFPRVRLNLMKLVRPSWYVGLRYWMDNYKIKDTESGGILDRRLVRGAKGGLISSFGLVSLYDTRNNYNFPTKGTYFELVALPNLKAYGSDFEFARFSLDYVNFMSWKENILALNFFAVAMTGEVPFNELAFIGGRSKMRGYIAGRFRDKNLVMAQAEYRRFISARIGFVAFTGFGMVAPDIDAYDISDIRASGGFGLRYRLDEKEKINVRFDVAYGEQGSSGIYFTIGEAF